MMDANAGILMCPAGDDADAVISQVVANRQPRSSTTSQKTDSARDIGNESLARIVNTPGTIGVLSSDASRYAAFHQCLAALEKPAGTKVHIEIVPGYRIARGRNAIVKDFIGEWVWFIDDDHVFAPDTLMRLLRHLEIDDVDAVAPLYLMRDPNHRPLVFAWKTDFSNARFVKPSPYQTGLHRVGATGTAGMLIRRRVFDRVGWPWFKPLEVPNAEDTNGAEDLFFCRRMAELGLKLYCDFDVAIGHLLPMAVWPARTESGFQLQYIAGCNGAPKHAAELLGSYASVNATSETAGGSATAAHIDTHLPSWVTGKRA